MATLSPAEFESLIADGEATGLSREDLVLALQKRGVTSPPQMSAASDQSYLGRLGSSALGGVQEAAGGSLWLASQLGKLANTQGASPLGFSPEVVKAFEKTGDVVMGAGERQQRRAEQGLEGVAYGGVKAAGFAGEFADLIVGLGAGAIARRAIAGKSMRKAIAEVRSGSVDDAAKLIDDLVGDTLPRASGPPKSSGMAEEARRIAAEEAANPTVPRSMLGGDDLPESVLDAARRERTVASRAAGEAEKFPGLPKRDPIKLVEDEVAKVAKVGDDLSKGALSGLDDADIIGKEARRSLDEAIAAEKGSPVGGVEFHIKNFKQFANNLGHQFFGRRGMATISAARREKMFKKLIPDKGLREDMLFYTQKTGNPNKGPKDAWSDVSNRIRQHEDGELALQIGDAFRHRFDEMIGELNDLNVTVGDDAINYLDNYVRQMWDFSGTPSGKSFSLKTIDDSEKVRMIANYRAGIMGAGLKPRTLDLAEVWHLSERALGRTSATKKLFRDLGEFASSTLDNGMPGIQRVSKNSAVPAGYRTIGNRILDRAIPPMSGKGHADTKLLIHDELYRPLANMLKVRSYDDFTKGADKFFSILKRMNFSFSLFHAYSLTESAINALGPIQGLRMASRLVKKGGAIPGLGRLADDFPGGAKGMSEFLKPSLAKDNEARAMMHGVSVGAPPTDLMRGAWEEATSSAVEKLNKRALTRPLSKGLKGYASVQKSIDTALWDRYHHPMKVETFNLVNDQMLALKRGGFKGASDHPVLRYLRPGKNRMRKKLADVSDVDIGQAVGKFINDEFGGQAWELASSKLMQKFVDPDNPHGLNGLTKHLFLSPDWNVSSIRAGSAFTHALGGDPVRGYLGVRHWRNAAAGAAFYANMANYVATKASTGSGKFIWENEPGKQLWHIDTGMKDNSGKKVFLRWGKQYQELAGLFQEIPLASFALRKMHPIIQAGFSPYDRQGYPTAMGRTADQAAKEARELGMEDYVSGYGEDLIRSVLPFMLTSAENLDTSMGKKMMFAATPMPKSRGMSLFKSAPLLAEAFRVGDFDKVGKLQNALLENGYTLAQVDRVTKTSRTKAGKYR